MPFEQGEEEGRFYLVEKPALGVVGTHDVVITN